MIIRNIKPDDLNACVDLAEVVMPQTIYNGCTISKQKIRTIMPQVTAYPSRWYFRVADDDGKIRGFLWGMIEALIFSTKDWYATDVVFVVQPDSHCGSDLMDDFSRWYKIQARRCPGRFIPLLGNSSGKLGVNSFYQRNSDLRCIGGLFSEKIQPETLQ